MDGYVKEKGFSLVELLVTVFVAAIFVVLAVPSFHSIRQNNQVTAIANYLSSGVILARNEAIKRGITVSVCGASSSAQNSCSNSTNWQNGYIIFTDTNGDGVLDSGDEIIRVGQRPTLGATISAPGNSISFSANGFVVNGAGDFLVQASGCQGENARTITLSNTGRLSVISSLCS